jgi:murein DD-endopeptidase MepM/ murein hydrolase activator NlpD
VTFQKILLFLIIGFCFFGFLSHLSVPSEPGTTSTAIASIPEKNPTPQDLPNDTPVTKQICLEISGKINSGDTLKSSLRRCEIPKSLHAEIINTLKKSLDLRSLHPGDTFTAGLDSENNLIKFNYIRNPLESYTISRKDNTYLVHRDDVKLKIETVVIQGKIENSLFNVFLGQGEKGKLVYAYADIFAAKIDFNTECRKGDEIKTVFEKYYKDGKFVGYGKILYAEYKQQTGSHIEGFYYTPANTQGAYFADDGQELGSSFIKSPVPVGRLTSRFTWHRKHPILGVVRPHLGIDLAAPVGTPIMAAGDGKVIFAGRRGGFGRQIILAHANGYKTYYGHLSRFKKGLHKGCRVKQKEIIGYVGSSGISTGPHLDYRLSLNGVYKNPLKIKFKAKSFLRGAELATFKQQKEEFKEKINRFKPQQIVEVRQVVIDSSKDITKIL